MSSPRLVLLLSEQVEEWCDWFPMLSKYSSILSSMLQIWTCLLHNGTDLSEASKFAISLSKILSHNLLLFLEKNRIFSQALYLLRTRRPIGNKLLWETRNDMLLYISCLLCLSYAPLKMLFPMDWLKPVEQFCSVWLSKRPEGRNALFSSLEWNILDWRWFDRQNEEQRIQQSYCLLGYCLIHFIDKQSCCTKNDDWMYTWWTSLANCPCWIRVLAYLALNAQQFASVHEQILKYVLLECNDTNWPKLIRFLFGEDEDGHYSSSVWIASRCLIRLFRGLVSNACPHSAIPQVAIETFYNTCSTFFCLGIMARRGGSQYSSQFLFVEYCVFRCWLSSFVDICCLQWMESGSERSCSCFYFSSKISVAFY